MLRILLVCAVISFPLHKGYFSLDLFSSRPLLAYDIIYKCNEEEDVMHMSELLCKAN